MLHQTKSTSRLAAATLLAAILAGCGGSGGSTPAATPAPAPVAQTIVLSKLASSEVLAGSASLNLTATPDAASTVTWTLDAGPGTLTASTGATIGYTPPAAGVTAPVNVVITAKAGNASQSLQLTLYPNPGTTGVALLAGDVNTDYLYNPTVIAEKDGQGASAVFGRPTVMAGDGSGNLYVIDYATLAVTTQYSGPSELVLRKVSAGGAVTTVARDTTETGTPNSLVVDKAGNIYVATRPLTTSTSFFTTGGDIRKITPDGKVTAFAGSLRSTAPGLDGTGTAASFTGPALAGIDADGNLYVKDVDDSAAGKLTLRKVTPQAVVSTIAALPAGLGQAPDGYTYGVDSEQATVFRTAADGTKTVLAGMPGKQGTVLGALPGGLLHPRAVVRTGPASLAVLSGSGVVSVVLPH